MPSAAGRLTHSTVARNRRSRLIWGICILLGLSLLGYSALSLRWKDLQLLANNIGGNNGDYKSNNVVVYLLSWDHEYVLEQALEHYSRIAEKIVVVKLGAREGRGGANPRDLEEQTVAQLLKRRRLQAGEEAEKVEIRTPYADSDDFEKQINFWKGHGWKEARGSFRWAIVVEAHELVHFDLCLEEEDPSGGQLQRFLANLHEQGIAVIAPATYEIWHDTEEWTDQREVSSPTPLLLTDFAVHGVQRSTHSRAFIVNVDAVQSLDISDGTLGPNSRPSDIKILDLGNPSDSKGQVALKLLSYGAGLGSENYFQKRLSDLKSTFPKRFGEDAPHPWIMLRHQLKVTSKQEILGLHPRQCLSAKSHNHAFVAMQSWQDAPPAHLPVFEQTSGKVGDKVILLGGFSPNIKVTRKEAQVWDVQQNKWFPLEKYQPLPKQAAETHQATTAGGDFLFIVGGQVGGGCSDDIVSTSWALHVPSNKWLRLPDLPEARAVSQAAFLGDGELHIVGGVLSNRQAVTTSHFVLHIGDVLQTPDLSELQDKLLKLQWTKDVDIPLGGDHASSIVVDGSWYILGGQHGNDGSTPAHDCITGEEVAHPYAFRYDFGCDTSHQACRQWTRLSDTPLPFSHAEYAAVHFEGFIIVMGGQSLDKHLLSSIQAYSIADDLWSMIGKLPNGQPYKSTSAWLQDCKRSVLSKPDTTECKVFMAAGEPGDPDTGQPKRPCVNTVKYSLLHFVMAGWPETNRSINPHFVEKCNRFDGCPSPAVPPHMAIQRFLLEDRTEMRDSGHTGVFVRSLMPNRAVGPIDGLTLVRMGSSSTMSACPASHSVEILYTLSGTGYFVSDGRTMYLEPGTVLFLSSKASPPGSRIRSSTRSNLFFLRVQLNVSEDVKLPKVVTLQDVPPVLFMLPDPTTKRVPVAFRSLLNAGSIPGVKQLSHLVWPSGLEQKEWDIHQDEESLLFTIGGSLILSTGQEHSHKLSAGELVLLPRNVRHRAWVEENEGPWTGLVLEVKTTTN